MQAQAALALAVMPVPWAVPVLRAVLVLRVVPLVPIMLVVPVQRTTLARLVVLGV